MSEIKIQEIPQWITFDDIHELLYLAHESNRKQGFNVKTSEMSGPELQKRLGVTGKCFVALDGEKLVGTASYRVLERNNWYFQGKVVDLIHVGVHPDYKGKKVFSMLLCSILEEAKNEGYLCVECRTSADNIPMQKAVLKYHIKGPAINETIANIIFKSILLFKAKQNISNKISYYKKKVFDSKKMEEIMNEGISELVFVIGSS